jgi:hypothetical protein
MTAVAADGATDTMPPIVSATAAPTNSGPIKLKIEAITIACSGVAARVATSVAIAFDASCSPFVVAEASANAIAIASPGSIDRLYARSAGGLAPALACATTLPTGRKQRPRPSLRVVRAQREELLI